MGDGRTRLLLFLEEKHSPLRGLHSTAGDPGSLSRPSHPPRLPGPSPARVALGRSRSPRLRRPRPSTGAPLRAPGPPPPPRPAAPGPERRQGPHRGGRGTAACGGHRSLRWSSSPPPPLLLLPARRYLVGLRVPPAVVTAEERARERERGVSERPLPAPRPGRTWRRGGGGPAGPGG